MANVDEKERARVKWVVSYIYGRADDAGGLMNVLLSAPSTLEFDMV